ncbi:MAG: diguanylate cyclase [Elusimicrobia bacterium CG_4_10_14_3_um_filter_49_12_50_7]|nr:MAG: diguanylate cyclase [Elusimicrobia bacterium CG03_land_8_20_14_0_80_50_18]PIX14420.1 MAG: diguanylate cyclase [Elusimicrobia bacterium CG_4_8_14_3_um_filter_50_9]PIY17532.1 MAG: diguanylate cyclase [Elusimicrobia bacterium CG_4_10_14_3_um_filter_49_12_50_7]
MLRYILRRLVSYIPLLIGITLISFLIMRLSPGGPELMSGFGSADSDPEVREKIVRVYGLDRPLHEQYLKWLGNIVTLDFGVSFQDGRSVSKKIMERLPATILLNVCSLFFIFLLAVPAGVYSAAKPGSFFDRAVTILVFAGFSVPAYWLALIFMDYFGVRLGILPISGMVSSGWDYFGPFRKTADVAWHLILPVFISAFTGLASLSRYVRAEMKEVLAMDFITAARARGVSEGDVIWKHAFRNALLPLATLIGLMLPSIIGGGVIFETIFSWPGVGRLMYQAVMARDYPLIMGNGVIVAVLTLAGNFIADVSYAYIDPRIRYK